MCCSGDKILTKSLSLHVFSENITVCLGMRDTFLPLTDTYLPFMVDTDTITNNFIFSCESSFKFMTCNLCTPKGNKG